MEDWKRILESLDVAVVVQQTDLRITYANAKAGSLLGISVEEFTGRTADDARWDVITPDGQAVSDLGHPGVRAMRRGEAVQGVVLGVRRGDSSERTWILASAIPEFDGDGKVTNAIVTFTDVNVAQRAIREQEATYATVFESMSEGLVIHEPDGSIRAANPAAEQVLGLTLEQMCGRAATDPRWRLMQEDGSAVDPSVIPSEIAAKTGRSVSPRILGVHRPEGEVVWLSVRADPLREPGDPRLRGVVAMFTDVTRQRETQLALEASRAQVQRVLDAVPGIVYQYLHPLAGEDRLTIVGGRISELLGLPADLVRATPDGLFSFIEADERAALMGRIAATVAEARDFDDEVNYRHPSGELRRMRIHGVPERTEAGLLYTGVILDVTAAHRLADVMRRTQRREAMGDLAAGIAHNFNNMLAVILPNLEMAREEAPATTRELLDDASRAAVSAAELVKRMLSLGRGDGHDDGATCDLAAVVRESIQFCRQTFDRTIRIEEELPAGELWVCGGSSALQQVVLNLCLNARDAVAEVARPRVRISLSPTREGDAVLVIEDNGRGMSAETLRRAGEPFFTTKAVGRGTGLGLATAFHTLKESGGSWQVDSKPGAGATFTLRIPAAERGRGERPSATPVPSQGIGTVMVVDDEPLVRDVMRRQLERAGYRTLIATSGPDALALIERVDISDLSVILLDLSMPEMSGAEALPLLVARAPGVPVVVLSGHVPDVRGLEQSAAILQKPIRNRELLEALETVRATRASPIGPGGNGPWSGRHQASGAAGAGWSGPRFVAETVAWMKFSEGTGVPESRRSSASWPTCVIASASGPCSSCSSVSAHESVGSPRSCASPSSCWWNRATSSASVGTGGGAKSPPRKKVRA